MASEGFMAKENIPFGIRMESPNAFCPTNGMRDHSCMHDDDLPRRNIQFLIDRHQANATEVGVKSGAGQSWVSRYLNNKIDKANPEKIGLVAKFFNVSASDVMWTDLSASADASPSQPVGSEREIVAAAVKLVSEMEAMAPEPLPKETYADRLYVAMKVVQEEGAAGIMDDSNVIVALRRFAAELRKTG